VVTPRPGRIDRVIDIDLPWPRDLAAKRSAKFAGYVADIQGIFHGFGIL
jgi:NitT/TauT family transport system ATP-binding protein